MNEQTKITNRSRLEANRAYSAKISWKRKETIELRRQIKEFIETNFEITLPGNFNTFKKLVQVSEIFNTVAELYGELIRSFYTLGTFGDSIGTLFTNANGQNEVFIHAHLFSKNRIDPVWNWKKSKLIRSIYYRFLKDTNIHNEFNPVHITLTMPHPGGLYQGKQFYAKELIEAFNSLRKQSWWKHYVYAGEYGIEVTGGENGLHIHAHSLAFLYAKNLKPFRDRLKKEWEKLTGASQSWVESLFIYKKEDNGQFICQMVDADKLETHEENDGMYITAPEGKKIIRKKFYIADEKKRINQSDQTPEEKETEILELYTRAILECIKYHFKNDTIKLADGNYNIFLINEILVNTKNKRLYSRFGNFYKEQALNFNHLEKGDEVTFNEANTETAIDPDTLEEVAICDTQLVLYKPEQINYRGKLSTRPNTPYNHDAEIYELMAGKSVKEMLTILIKTKFNKHKILPHDNLSDIQTDTAPGGHPTGAD